jgi:uncharacterized membrane protein YuzA (DUF378 family)
MKLIWSLIWRLQGLARFLVIQLLGKRIKLIRMDSVTSVLGDTNTISVPAYWIIGISFFAGFTAPKTRGEKTQFNLGFI